MNVNLSIKNEKEAVATLLRLAHLLVKSNPLTGG